MGRRDERGQGVVKGASNVTSTTGRKIEVVGTVSNEHQQRSEGCKLENSRKKVEIFQNERKASNQIVSQKGVMIILEIKTLFIWKNTNSMVTQKNLLKSTFLD